MRICRRNSYAVRNFDRLRGGTLFSVYVANPAKRGAVIGVSRSTNSNPSLPTARRPCQSVGPAKRMRFPSGSRTMKALAPQGSLFRV